MKILFVILWIGLIVVFAFAVVRLYLLFARFFNNRKVKKNYSVFEKIRDMSFDEMSEFLDLISSFNDLPADLFCVNCETSGGGCSADGDWKCNFTRMEIIQWFLNQPYDYFRLAVEE